MLFFIKDKIFSYFSSNTDVEKILLDDSPLTDDRSFLFTQAIHELVEKIEQYKKYVKKNYRISWRITKQEVEKIVLNAKEKELIDSIFEGWIISFDNTSFFIPTGIIELFMDKSVNFDILFPLIFNFLKTELCQNFFFLLKSNLIVVLFALLPYFNKKNKEKKICIVDSSGNEMMVFMKKVKIDNRFNFALYKAVLQNFYGKFSLEQFKSILLNFYSFLLI